VAGIQTSPSFLVSDLDPNDARSVSELHRDVLAPHFRVDELEDEATMTAGLRSGATQATVARSASGQIVGGVVGDWFAASRVMLLSYIATRPGVRGGGIGTRLLTTAMAAWTTRREPLLVVVEVEDPRHHHDTTFGDPWARLRFYERLGIRALNLPYFQPALGGGRERVQDLLLMVAGGSAAPPEATSVDGELVERFLVEYFEVCEGPAAEGDAAALRLLEACRAPGGPPLLAAGELPGSTDPLPRPR
jgi:GNAT superfamily N-acetyltransferase